MGEHPPGWLLRCSRKNDLLCERTLEIRADTPRAHCTVMAACRTRLAKLASERNLGVSSIVLDNQMTASRESVTINIGTDVVDIPTMEEMSAIDYRDYLESSLLFVDHHGALRAIVGEYPVAATKAQIDALIEYLRDARQRMPK